MEEISNSEIFNWTSNYEVGIWNSKNLWYPDWASTKNVTIGLGISMKF